MVLGSGDGRGAASQRHTDALDTRSLDTRTPLVTDRAMTPPCEGRTPPLSVRHEAPLASHVESWRAWLGVEMSVQIVRGLLGREASA